MGKYESLIDSPADRRLFEAIKSARKPYDECYIRVLDLSRRREIVEAQKLIGTQLIPLRNAFLKAAEAEVVWNKADGDDSINQIAKAMNWTSTGMLICLFCGVGIACFAMVIRKRLQIEHKLRESTEQFRAVFEQAADGVVITDVDAKIRFVNPAFASMTGYSREEVLGQSPRLLQSGRTPAAFCKELWNTIRAGRIWHGDLVNRRKDGTLYNEEMRIAPMREANGILHGYIAIKRDVTEQRAAQEAQAFLAAIVASSRDAMIATTMEGFIRAWNGGAETVFGYSADEVVGKHVSMLMGSTFWFTVTFGHVVLDQRESAPQSGTFQQKTAQSAVNPYLQGHGERILIAEDNLTNREVILAQLQKLGYQAAVAANGVEAVDAVERESFDLVLMDCQMPLMDGYEATRRIRGSNPAHIPIVALTASAMSPARERCLSEGMDDYLAKPVDLPHLAAVLAKWLPSRAGNLIPLPQTSGDKPAASIFNADPLLRRLMGERELACAVLHVFIDDAPSQLKQLCARLDESDIPGTRLRAHTLKGAAATVGAETLRDIALDLEVEASEGRLERCPDLLVRAIDAFECFKRTVEHDGWVSKATGTRGIEETSDV
jgi:PAS domain S-box-containing protein